MLRALKRPGRAAQRTATGLGAELGERTGLAGLALHCRGPSRGSQVEVQVAVGRATRVAARGAEEAVATVGDLGR
jgi:hypothetical protein